MTCSTDKPWGLHLNVRNDALCPRCGWRAPGPLGDALEEARARAAELGWSVHEGSALAA